MTSSQRGTITLTAVESARVSELMRATHGTRASAVRQALEEGAPHPNPLDRTGGPTRAARALPPTWRATLDRAWLVIIHQGTEIVRLQNEVVSLRTTSEHHRPSEPRAARVNPCVLRAHANVVRVRRADGSIHRILVSDKTAYKLKLGQAVTLVAGRGARAW